MIFHYALLVYATIALAATPAEWRGRSIYQVLTDRYARPDGSTTSPCDTAQSKYCGGTWRGIINKLDYIQQMGFTAIWISPVTHNILNDGAFHGYWQDDIYDLNPNFGTADDLKALSSALHDRGMYLMVDVVANHFAWAGTVASIDYSTFIPFNSSDYFHSPCGLDGNDSDQANLENCWLGFNTPVELPDVDTTRQDVKDLYYAWIKNLAATYSIDGFRVDTVKHVQKDFWPTFNQDAGVYCVGEVFSGDPGYVCDYQNYMDGLLNYPLYYPLTRAFQSISGSMSDLVNMVNTLKSGCKDSTLLGTFLENHDNPRFPNLTNDLALDQNAIAFTILADGIPVIYEGQEQHYSGGNDPNNREAIWLSGYSTTSPLYTFIAKVNQIRNQAIFKDGNYLNYKAFPIYSDTTTIAMRKGFDGAQIISVFSNKGSQGDSYTQSIPNTGFSSSDDIVEILGCTHASFDSSGNLSVSMGQGAARIFYPASQLSGSGICGL